MSPDEIADMLAVLAENLLQAANKIGDDARQLEHDLGPNPTFAAQQLATQAAVMAVRKAVEQTLERHMATAV